jgi:hypothetical protein
MKGAKTLIASWGVASTISVLTLTWSSEARNLPAVFVCFFNSGVFSAPENGQLVSAKAHDTMALTYASIDPERGTAQMVANAGAADVAFIEGRDAIHFLEITGAGYLTVTTVYTSVDREGGFYASHMRHVGTGSEPMISHYLGTCDARWS